MNESEHYTLGGTYIYIYIYVCEREREREREREILLIYKLLVFPFMFGVLVTASCN